jgi:hypothetical protein
MIWPAPLWAPLRRTAGQAGKPARSAIENRGHGTRGFRKCCLAKTFPAGEGCRGRHTSGGASVIECRLKPRDPCARLRARRTASGDLLIGLHDQSLR